LREVDCDDECCGVRWTAADVIDWLNVHIENLETERKWLASPAEVKELNALIKYKEEQIMKERKRRIKAERELALIRNLTKSGCNI
jgi:hypothetical protein